jgi:MFS family permease
MKLLQTESVARLAPCLINFFSSMAVMVLELVAGRLVSDSVGSSQYTWVSIIAVILAGMSLGNWYGGRLADRYPPRRILWILFFAAAVLVLLTLLLGHALSALKGAFLPLVVTHPGGSSHLWGISVFFMMALVFLWPATALGALSPVIARMAIDAHASSGRAVGNVHAWGAVGMIVGTFLTGFVLVEHLHVSTILVTVATVMALLGGLTRWKRFWEICAPRDPGSAVAKPDENAPAEEAPARGDVVALWRRYRPNVTVFVTSLCLMGLEVVAGRLISRHVGSSIYTWTTLIGVVFAGMSIGNYLGGRLAARVRPARVLGQLLVLASVLCVSVVWLQGALRAALNPAPWPHSAYLLPASVTLSERSFKSARARGVPEPVLSKLEALKGEELAEEGLRKRLATALSVDELREHGGQILGCIDLRGSMIRALREDGVPDEVLRRLHPIANQRFRDAAELDQALRALLRPEGALRRHEARDLNRWRYHIERLLKQDTLFRFPVRLLLVVLFVLLAPSIALGMISPLAAQMAIAANRSTGRAVGNVYAWGAWGSILGTALTGFYLLGALGSYATLAAAAVLLALIAVLAPRPRLPQIVWLVMLLVLVVPTFHQLRSPSATDPDPGAVAEANHGSSWLGRVWASIPELLGNTVHLRDKALSENAKESDYQFIRVRVEPQGKTKTERRILSLDNLRHGYLTLKMPVPGAPFRYDASIVDSTTFDYDYEEVYAVLTARAVKDRNTLGPPRLKGLFLGAGPYTFPRYFVEKYSGETYVATEGETLAAIAEKKYGATADTDRSQVAERLRIFNRAVLAGAAEPEPGTRLRLPSFADVVEIDPVVTEVNYTRLRLERPEKDPRIQTWNYDARNFVESAIDAGWQGKYDLVYADAFNHFTIPYHLTTREFNEKAKALLTPRGAFLANIIDKYETCRFLGAYVNTLRQSYRFVQVVGAKEERLRTGRSTFVVVGSDVPIALEFLGGYPDETMELIRQGDVAALRNELRATDPLGLRRLQDLIAKGPEGAEGAYGHVAGLRRLDLAALDRSQSPGEKLKIRAHAAFSPAEVDHAIIERGRLGGFGSGLGGRAPAEFELDARSLEELRSKGMSDDVSAKLQPLLYRRFATVEPFLERLSELLSPAEAREHKKALLFLARRWGEGKRPPLVLTDDFAPVDDLLAPLLE